MKQHINLYLPEFHKRRDPLTLAAMFASIAGLVLVLVLVSSWQYVSATRQQDVLGELRAELARTTAENARLAESQGALVQDRSLLETVSQLEAGLGDKRALLGFLAGHDPGNTVGFSGHLDVLSRHLVPGLRLTRIELLAGGEKVLLAGEVSRPENLPLYLMSLGEARIYDGRRFETLRMDGVGANGLLRFEVLTSDGSRP